MGMAASQARLLSLQARQSNLEYQGQQINQERSILSQQCTALYNSLLAMQVPTPPSTSDFTTIQYTGTDGATEFTIGAVKPYKDDKYIVEMQTAATGDSLQQIHGSYQVTPPANRTVNCVSVDPQNESPISSTEIGNYYVLESGAVRPAMLSDFVVEEGVDGQETKYRFDENKTYYRKPTSNDSEENIVTQANANADRYLIGDNEAYTIEEAKQQPWASNYEWDRYITAIKNSYGDSITAIGPEDFYVFRTTNPDTGVEELRFALITDVESTDNYTAISKYSENGKFTKSEEKKDCMLQFDTQGRITKISIPSSFDKDNNAVAWRELDLVAETITDNAAYQDAYNKYEYAQYEYDKKQQEINAKTEIIQQEDRNLELKLQRLDNERTQITTEIEAVEKVVGDNIESTYKTFSG